jgi:hypothetical protein
LPTPDLEPTHAPDFDVPMPDGDIVVLPREIADDGRGLYDESVITIVKEFRSLDVGADYLHGPDERSWIGERAIPPLVIDLIVGITSNAGWSALCRLLGKKHPENQVQVRVGRIRGKQFSADWYKIEGPGKDVADVIAAMGPAGLGESNGEEEQKALPEGEGPPALPD